MSKVDCFSATYIHYFQQKQIEKQNKHFATLQADEETQCDHQSSIYSLQQIFVYKVKKHAYLVHACMFTLA